MSRERDAEVEALAEYLCDVRAANQDAPLRSWYYIAKNGMAAESWRAVARAALVWCGKRAAASGQKVFVADSGRTE